MPLLLAGGVKFSSVHACRSYEDEVLEALYSDLAFAAKRLWLGKSNPEASTAWGRGVDIRAQEGGTRGDAGRAGAF